LRAAREARGWSAADIASRLHLPIQIVQKLETDRFDEIGHRIYLRGYLTSYVRLLDLPTVLVESVLQQHQEQFAPPPLTTTGTISHSRYLFQRYSVSALYLILTGVIIVPAVLLAMRAGLEPKITDLTSLDTTNAVATSEAGKSNAQPATSTPSADSMPEAAAPPAAANAGAASDSPLVASMAPFHALAHKESEAAQAPPASVSGSGTHTLRLSLKEASWVEVTSASGEKLEYGLLPAGTVRTISSDSVLDVRVGNSGGAEVELDGQMQDLAPYRHSNVAHFKAFAAGQPISAY
jgi:cytoskeleton protein RodZ